MSNDIVPIHMQSTKSHTRQGVCGAGSIIRAGLILTSDIDDVTCGYCLEILDKIPEMKDFIRALDEEIEYLQLGLSLTEDRIDYLITNAIVQSLSRIKLNLITGYDYGN